MNTRTPKPNPKQNETLPESIASFFVLAAIWIFAITFAFQNFVIPSASMASTLLVGDHVLVDRVTFALPGPLAPFVHHRDPQRNDIVVFFKPPAEPTGDHIILVKRVIGIPGDRIHLRHGILFRNGIAQTEPFAAQPNALNYDPYRDDFPSVPPPNRPDIPATWTLDLPTHTVGQDLVVPPHSYFVMGDNRTNSLDGRFWGFVPRQNIIGRPVLIYWSFRTPEDQIDKTSLSDRIAFTTHQALHFFDETRWSRTLKVVQ
jgi:signal peptidase I